MSDVLLQNGWIVLKNQDPLIIHSVIPHAQLIKVRGEEMIAVKHHIDTVQILRNIGIPAPSPINYGWKYPGRFTPFEHQRETAAFLTVHRKAFVLSEMGVGKTCSAIWAAEYLMQAGIIKRVLIIAPKSCLNKVWGYEIFGTTSYRTAVVLTGSREKRRALYKTSAPYVIINYDAIGTIADLVKADKTIDLVIVDEASKFRNGMTHRYKTLKTMLRPETRLWLVTGTPCSNAPTDAWALARLVKPELVPPFFNAFKRKTMNQLNQFKWIARHDAHDTVFAALQPAIRYRKKDLPDADLNSLTYQNRECELSSEQKRVFDVMRKQLTVEHDGGRITAVNAAVKLLKLLQILCGVVYDDTGVARFLDDSPRIEALQEIIEECERKVIVWVPFKSVLYHLVKTLNKDGKIAEGVCGDTTQSERDRIFSAFQDDNNPLKVLVAHPGTAAHGLTLTAANTIVWYGPFFSAELYQQACARIDRPGQKYDMTIIHLGATPLEWGAYAVVRDKTNRQDKILDLYKGIL